MNLNIEAGQTWRDNYVIVTIDKIESAAVQYTQRSANTNVLEVTKGCVLVSEFRHWISSGKAKFVKPKERPMSAREKYQAFNA